LASSCDAADSIRCPGQLDEGQQHQLLPHPPAGRGVCAQELAGRVQGLAQCGQRIGRHDFHRLARHTGAVGFHRQARLAPHIQRTELARRQQLSRSVGAAVIGVALAVPQAAYLIPHVGAGSALDVFDQQRVAAHLLVVLHAVLGVVLGKLRPIAALAQQLQPVVAQAVFVVSARPALQKALHFLCRGVVQPGLELPVGRPGLQRMALGLGKELFEPFAVALAKSLLHVQQHLVPLGLGQNRGRGRSQQRTGHQRCQNLR
jgi:hypothetical protein